MTPFSAASPLGATVSVLASPVEVASADPGSFAAAIDGQTLYKGDTIRTGPGGMALLTFFDGSESQLDGESQVQIELVIANPAPQIAFLQTAGVTVNHVIPMPEGGSFRTDTPAATGLVRGTSYVVIVGSASTCGPAGDQPCVASMILLTDRNGHVGRVDVAANDSSATAVQLSRAGAVAAASSRTVTASNVDPDALAQLEGVAHVRNDTAASITAEHQVRAIAATLTPVALDEPTTASETVSVPEASSAKHDVTEPTTTKDSPPATPPTQTPSKSNASATATAHSDHHTDTIGQADSGQGTSGQGTSGQGTSGAAHPVSVATPPDPPHADPHPVSVPAPPSPPAPLKVVAPPDVAKSAPVGPSARAPDPGKPSDTAKSDKPKT